MAKISEHLAAQFQRLAQLIYNKPVQTLLLMSLLILPLVIPIYRINLDASAEGILHESDPSIHTYNEFRERFGTDNFIIVAVESPNIFDSQFLRKFKSLHRELRDNVPHLEDVTSLANARYVRGFKDDKIVSGGFLVGIPKTQAQEDALRQRVLGNPLIKNIYVSEDGRFATILLRTKLHSSQQSMDDILNDFGEDDFAADEESYDRHYLTYVEKNETASAVKEILAEYDATDFKTYVSGTDMISTYVKDEMARNMKIFILLSLLIIAGALFLMFRRLSGILLPLLIIILTLTSTLGLMVWAGVPIKITSQIIPSFLLAVCVCDSVHILAIFFQHYKHCRDKEQAVIFAISHSGLPIVLTSITTAAGLLSFASADIAPIVDVGIFASTGVMLGLVYSIILLPAILALLPLQPESARHTAATDTRMDALLAKIADIACDHPKKIVLISALLVAFFGYQATQVRFSHDILSWFPDDNPIKVATELIDRELKGTVNLEVIIDTRQENGILNPDLLKRLETAADDLEQLEVDEIFGGKALSINVLLKEINRAIHENQDEFYSVPQDPDIIAQEIIVLENSAQRILSGFTDSRYSMARFTIKVPFRDSVRYTGFLAATQTYFEENFPEAQTSITGMMPLLHTVSERVVSSTKKSYAIAIMVITLVMVLMIGNLKIGLLSMIPNLSPIIFGIGMMGLLNISIDASTMMAGSIAVGLAVDDTIHFMHIFRRYYSQSLDPRKAVHETLQTTGRAIFVTSLVLAFAFFIFMFASLKNMVYFGLITGLTIIMALLADYFLSPALMVLVNRDRSKETSS